MGSFFMRKARKDETEDPFCVTGREGIWIRVAGILMRLLDLLPTFFLTTTTSFTFVDDVLLVRSWNKVYVFRHKLVTSFALLEQEKNLSKSFVICDICHSLPNQKERFGRRIETLRLALCEYSRVSKENSWVSS